MTVLAEKSPQALTGLLKDAPRFQAPPIEGLLFSRVDGLPPRTLQYVTPVVREFALPPVINEIAMGVGIPGATRPEAVVEQAARVVDAEGASPAILPLVFNEGLLLGDRDPRRVTNAVRDPEGPGVELRARTAERTTRLLVAGYLGELHDSAPAPQDGIDLVEQAGELARAVVEEAAEYARFGQLEADATPRVVDVHLPELSGTIARPSAGPVAESPHTDVVLAPWDPRQTGY